MIASENNSPIASVGRSSRRGVTFTEVKHRLVTRIEELCRELLPEGKREGNHWLVGDISGKPGRSLEVELAGLKAGLWLDRAGTDRGDAIDLIAAAQGLTKTAALEWACGFLGLSPQRSSSRGRLRRQSPRPVAPTTESLLTPALSGSRSRENWPDLLVPSPEHIKSIAAIRGLPAEGLQLADQRGILRVGHYMGQPCWFVTDHTRTGAQARRIDGNRFFRPDGPKGLSLQGTNGQWLVGVSSIRPEHRTVLLVEGGPDLLAAHCVIAAEDRSKDTAAVALLGASHRIPEDSLAVFRGRRVRVFEHSDAGGRGAVKAWANQLYDAGADVDFIRFDGLRRIDGEPVKDLNDFCQIHADDFEAFRWTWEVIP